jgi:hypothetical protein
MRRTQVRWLVTAIMAVPLVAWVISMGLRPVEQMATVTIVEAVGFEGATPAGEIVQGFLVVQPVRLSAEEARRSREAAGPEARVCARLLLGTYANRKNVGSVRVTVTQRGLELVNVINMRSVRDGALNEVCFPPGRFEGFSPSDLTLRVEGVNGASGASITALLGENVDRGTALINGEDSGKALVFSLVVERPAPYVSKAVVALSVVYAIMIAILVALAVRAWIPDAAPRDG